MSDSDHHHEHGPHCGHGHAHAHTPPKAGSKPLVWALVTTVAVGVGAYLISKLGEKSAADVAAPTPDDHWQQRMTESKSPEKYR